MKCWALLGVAFLPVQPASPAWWSGTPLPLPLPVSEGRIAWQDHVHISQMRLLVPDAVAVN